MRLLQTFGQESRIMNLPMNHLITPMISQYYILTQTRYMYTPEHVYICIMQLHTVYVPYIHTIKLTVPLYICVHTTVIVLLQGVELGKDPQCR